VALFKSRFVRWLAAAAVLAAILIAARSYWLGALGGFLVESEEPFHADLAVVLAGDDSGNRILKAAELVKQGYAPKVLVSGPECCYGRYESDLAIPFAVGHGYPAEWFIALPATTKSTREEALAILPELQRRQVRRFLVVTSDYHSRRAARVYRALAPAGSFRVVTAPDVYFAAERWWHNREGRKQFLLEWLKTVADWVGL
jgi:uncharacterized SAM-binding protein YcdF (DUF218 family)